MHEKKKTKRHLELNTITDDDDWCCDSTDNPCVDAFLHWNFMLLIIHDDVDDVVDDDDDIEHWLWTAHK